MSGYSGGALSCRQGGSGSRGRVSNVRRGGSCGSCGRLYIIVVVSCVEVVVVDCILFYILFLVRWYVGWVEEVGLVCPGSIYCQVQLLP